MISYWIDTVGQYSKCDCVLIELESYTDIYIITDLCQDSSKTP